MKKRKNNYLIKRKRVFWEPGSKVCNPSNQELLKTRRRNLRGNKVAPSAILASMNSNVLKEVWEQGSISNIPNNHELIEIQNKQRNPQLRVRKYGNLAVSDADRTTMNLKTWRRNLRGNKAAPSALLASMNSNVFKEVWEQGSISN